MSNTPEEVYLTPNRSTYLTVDTPQRVLLSAAYGRVRKGSEVAAPSVQGLSEESQRRHMKFWHSAGVWTLAPVQSQISTFTETDAYLFLIATLALLRHLPWMSHTSTPRSGLKESNSRRGPSDLTNVPTTPRPAPGSGGLVMAPSSDPFIEKVVAPAASPTDEPHKIDLNSDYRYPDLNIPVDRIAESLDIFPANQAFFLRWRVPGTVRHSPTRIWGVYFGQYHLSIDGDGYCRLSEAPNLQLGNQIWKLRHQFRYCTPTDVSHTQHSLAIWPCFDGQGRRQIVFANSEIDAAGVATGLDDYVSVFGSSLSESVYVVDTPARGNDPDLSPNRVTKQAIVRMEARRDLNIKCQVSKLGYPTSGVLIDLPDTIVPVDAPSTYPLNGTYDADVPNGSSLTLDILDADTDLPINSSPNRSKPYAKFTFTSNGLDTPRLRAYALYRKPVTADIDNSAFVVHSFQRVTLEAFDGNMESQRGEYHLEDITNAYPRLLKRGEYPCKVSTTFLPTPDSPPVEVVLHRGYIFRPRKKKKGKPGRTDSPAYPSPEWRSSILPLVGEEKRLRERVETRFDRIYTYDSAAPVDPSNNQKQPPWKVTAVIVDLLQAAGYAPDQIDIPDLPFRLWSGSGGAPSAWHIKPEVGYAETIARLARNYLGGWVYFCPQAGNNGQWRLLLPPNPASAPVYHFVTQPANPNIPPHILAAYPANTAPVLSEIDEEEVPPEFNMVYVRTYLPLNGGKPGIAYENWKHNPKSFNMPGFPQTADPNHPDYTDGRVRPCVILDPSLAGRQYNQISIGQITQAAVDWTVLRIYDFVCHAQVLRRFLAPLVFIFDTVINKWRPLQFQDKVTLNEVEFYVKGVTIDYTHDHTQVANYELIKPITDAD